MAPAAPSAGTASAAPIPANAADSPMPACFATQRPRSICPVWSLVFDAVPLPPAVVGAIAAALCSLVFLALDLREGGLDDLLAGTTPWFEHVEMRSALVIAALFAGVGVTYRYEELGSVEDVERLRPHLRLDAACERSLRDATHAAELHDVLAGGVLGSLLLVGAVPFLYRDPARFLRLDTYLLPSVMFDFAVAALLGGTIVRTLYGGVVQDRAFAQLAHSIRAVDLLDLEPMHVFSHRGLRRALRWAVLTALASLVFVDAGSVVVPAALLAGIGGFAVFSFVLPIRGAHARVRAEKRCVLEGLRTRIRCERERMEGNRASRQHGHLADLLAYEARIAAVPEWPIDSFTMLRFALYLLLPLGSWLGGALAERVIGALLG